MNEKFPYLAYSLIYNQYVFVIRRSNNITTKTNGIISNVLVAYRIESSYFDSESYSYVADAELSFIQ